MVMRADIDLPNLEDLTAHRRNRTSGSLWMSDGDTKGIALTYLHQPLALLLSDYYYKFNTEDRDCHLNTILGAPEGLGRMRLASTGEGTATATNVVLFSHHCGMTDLLRKILLRMND